MEKLGQLISIVNKKEQIIVKLPEFEGGDQDPFEWFDNFNERCRINGIADSRKLDFLGTVLRGPAKTWWTVIKPKIKSFDQGNRSFKNLFFAQYAGEDQIFKWEEDLDQTQQLKGETVTEFTSRLTRRKRIHPEESCTDTLRDSDKKSRSNSESILRKQ